MKKQTLKQVLKKYEGKEVKLGSGTCFVYCGIVNDDICDILDRYSKEEYEAAKISLFNKEEYKKDFERIWEKKWKERDEERISVEVFEINKAKDWLATLISIKNKRERIENWMDFIYRNVKEIYQSDVEEGVTIILFDGIEQGKYWNREEYDKANGLV